MSASPIPTLPDSQVPPRDGPSRMIAVMRAFVRRDGARRACGFDMRWSCIAPTATCWRVCFAAATNRRSDARGARWPIACAFHPLECSDARGMAARTSRCRRHLRHRLGRGRHHRRRRGASLRAPSARPASIWSTSPPDRPCATPQPVYGRMFQTPVLRTGPSTRLATMWRRQHHHIRSGQYHTRGRARRSRRARSAASGRSVVHAGRGLVRLSGIPPTATSATRNRFATGATGRISTIRKLRRFI